MVEVPPPVHRDIAQVRIEAYFRPLTDYLVPVAVAYDASSKLDLGNVSNRVDRCWWGLVACAPLLHYSLHAEIVHGMHLDRKDFKV